MKIRIRTQVIGLSADQVIDTTSHFDSEIIGLLNSGNAEPIQEPIRRATVTPARTADGRPSKYSDD